MRRATYCLILILRIKTNELFAKTKLPSQSREELFAVASLFVYFVKFGSSRTWPGEMMLVDKRFDDRRERRARAVQPRLDRAEVA